MDLSAHVHPLVSRRNPSLSQWPCFKWSVDEWAQILADVNLEFRVHQFQDDRNEVQWENRNLMQFQSNLSRLLKWIRSKTSSSSATSEPISKVAKTDESDHFDCLDPEQHWLYSSYNRLLNLVDKSHPLVKSIDWAGLGIAETSDGDFCAEKSTLWIGTAGAQTPCHYDTYGYNLVAQLHGR